ncbi:hypothetical protein F5882DRAFT_181288 [Hyaloscypha sp. PMI_1271]|nr:hypothetical protein F5882DRAFT_181288 [Hyaloscypha sp. PMI_1271]
MDQPGISQYDISKCSGRVVTRVLRQGTWEGGLMVNSLSLWMIPTGIIHAVGSVGWAGLFSTGIGNTPFEDTVEAVLKLATDTSVNGRLLGVVPHDIASEGYLDLDRDDQKEGDFVTRLEKDTIAALKIWNAKQ